MKDDVATEENGRGGRSREKGIRIREKSIEAEENRMIRRKARKTWKKEACEDANKG